MKISGLNKLSYENQQQVEKYIKIYCRMYPDTEQNISITFNLDVYVIGVDDKKHEVDATRSIRNRNNTVSAYIKINIRKCKDRVANVVLYELNRIRVHQAIYTSEVLKNLRPSRNLRLAVELVTIALASYYSTSVTLNIAKESSEVEKYYFRNTACIENYTISGMHGKHYMEVLTDYYKYVGVCCVAQKPIIDLFIGRFNLKSLVNDIMIISQFREYTPIDIRDAFINKVSVLNSMIAVDVNKLEN